MSRILAPLPFALAIALAACGKPPADSHVSSDAATAPAGQTAQKLSIDESALPQPVRLSRADIDDSISACQAFGDHVNARWLAANPIPADQTRWGSFSLLAERSLAVQHEIARAAAQADAAAGSITRKVGDFFASGMDQASIETAGLAPLQPLLDAIDGIADNAALPAFLRDSYPLGHGALFSLHASADQRDSRRNIAYLGQAGLSLPERSYYLDEREDRARIRAAFLAYVATVLTLAGADADQARAQAQQVMEFETRLARASLDRLSLRDPAARYNPMSLAEADALTPHFSWSAFFQSAGVAEPGTISLAMTDFFREVDTMLAETPVEQWKTWLRYRAINHAAPFLPAAYEQAHFQFHRQTIAGQQEQGERWKRVLSALNAGMGEALGQLYVAEAFPPESKAQMQELVANLSQALRQRLEQLDWMGEETRAKALEKWASFTPKIGYPDVWRDWSGAEISRDGYAANTARLQTFNNRYMLDKIGKPVDPNEWGMSPQTVNAYYRASANEIVFPAAILQPPFFDPDADPALNYGGIGAVIGHEMLHGYDDQGSKFDAEGNFVNWWTDQDRARFDAATDKLAAQFDAYSPLPGLHVNGRLALGENIADLGGLTVALDALRNSLGESFEDPMIDGYSQTQRFFMNWATVWRIAFTEEAMKVQLTVGPHAPGAYRAIGAPSNMPAFAEAFGCQPGDPMARGDEERVAIW